MPISPTSGAIEALLRDRRTGAEAQLAARLSDGVSQGELPKTLDPVATAKYLNCVLEGMSVQARDGATLADLRAIATRALAGWAVDLSPPAASDCEP